jgi:hypothetical protein
MMQPMHGDGRKQHRQPSADQNGFLKLDLQHDLDAAR